MQKTTPKGKPISSVHDNGRRGEPLRGCDCMQCFGYCHVEPEVREREIALRRQQSTVAEDA